MWYDIRPQSGSTPTVNVHKTDMTRNQVKILPLNPPVYPEILPAGKPLRYREYLALLAQLGGFTSWDQTRLAFYESAWFRMWDLHRDQSTDRLHRLMLYQLLTGCRAKSVSSLEISLVDRGICFRVPAVKGGKPSVFRYRALPPSLTHLLLPVPALGNTLSYWTYRRELREAAPNFYMARRVGCLGCTHLFRYFFVQVLHRVLCMPLPELTRLLGWRRGDSVESYLDSKIWISS